ncbi:MAG: formate/nitrite transporter family protein [Gemmatimonadaceae bacterium]
MPGKPPSQRRQFSARKSRSELFTEHTTLAILPLLSGRTTVARVARLWSLVYVGNMVGAAGFAALGAPLGVGLGLFMPQDVARMSHHLTDFGAVMIFGSAVAGVPFADYLRFRGLSTVGNAVGGIVFVGLVKFGHISASETTSPERR